MEWIKGITQKTQVYSEIFMFYKNGLQKIFDLIFSASINYKSLGFIAVLGTGFWLSPKDSFCPSTFSEEKPI